MAHHRVRKSMALAMKDIASCLAGGWDSWKATRNPLMRANQNGPLPARSEIPDWS